MIYYQDDWVTQYCSDALSMLRGLESDSVDLLCTDPPYGIGFMGKDWDKALPDKEIWTECLRVLKPGSFAFVMSIPRSDCQARMVIALQDAGFRIDFTPMYWAMASGFPKAKNIGKAVDKRLGAEREVVGIKSGERYKHNFQKGNNPFVGLQKDGTKEVGDAIRNLTMPRTFQAKALDGSYGGFQPKPAVEVIIVAMKPLSEKTFVDQALKNRKGITWLDDCRIPYESEGDIAGWNKQSYTGEGSTEFLDKLNNQSSPKSNTGRFPANLLVSDDVLNDGSNHNKGGSIRSAGARHNQVYGEDKRPRGDWDSYGDSGSFSRYFDLDKWYDNKMGKIIPELGKSASKTFPFLIVPKASKSEKNKGLLGGTGSNTYNRKCESCGKWERKQGLSDNYTCHCEEPNWEKPTGNNHPTVKPLKLMSYLITLGSRPGDTVVDPFGGSGTTALASKLLGRKCIISEIEEKYCEIAAKRCAQSVMRLEV